MNNDLKAALRERLDQNYKNFLEQLQGKTACELIARAPEITAARQLLEELPDACDEDDVEFLLRFDDPLEVVRGYWESEITGYDHSGEMGHMLWEIRDRELYSKDQLAQPEIDAGASPALDTQGRKSNANPQYATFQDAMTEEFEHIELFGKPALFSSSRIDRSSVPAGWYCYGVRGFGADPGRLTTLEAKVSANHVGAILSPEEIIFPMERDHRRINGNINFLGDSVTVAEFCEQYQLPVTAS